MKYTKKDLINYLVNVLGHGEEESKRMVVCYTISVLFTEKQMKDFIQWKTRKSHKI